ncbi:MAG TPA: hypothetical protein VGS96_17365 [Thermoanaerobaculia bacterium]|jgi:hypothetical protein|nr:hypothetical protein [Thermoanaerobaculia bacterium]
MTRRIILAALVYLLAFTARADIRGSWTASFEESDKMHFNFVRRHSNNGQTMSLTQFSGLTESQVRAETQTPVQFTMQREAGSMALEGTFKGGYGGGQFTFTPNRRYLDDVRALGVDTREITDDKDDVDEHLMGLAVQDVSTAYIKSMQAAGYRVGLEKYLEMRIFNVTPQLVAEFRDLGFDKIDADDLVATQIHGVTPQYIREMRAAGYTNLDLDDLLATRIHHATPEFAKEMKALGYDVKMEDLVAFRIHGVTPAFIRELRELGYTKIAADDLVAMRIHGVTPSFIRQFKEEGYEHIPVQKLIEMRIHGIDAQFVKRMNGSK